MLNRLPVSKSARLMRGRLHALDYHRIPVDELYSRLSTSPSQGLSSEKVARKLSEHGLNAPLPPSPRWNRKTMSYLFGGLGAILFVAAMVVFIAWKPLGEPAPAVANLALAIVLVFVWIAQASVNLWQGILAHLVACFPRNINVLCRFLHVHGYGFYQHNCCQVRVMLFVMANGNTSTAKLSYLATFCN